jgi:YidC/Oxa1 family membrane protein insertase
MDIKRTVLWVIFFMSAVMLYDNWQRDHGRPSMFFPNATQTQTQAAKGAAPESGAPASAPDLPSAATTAGAAPAATAGQPAEGVAQLVHFRTDVFDGVIDTRGGTVTQLSLLKERSGKEPNEFMTLFDHTNDHTYLARTGLFGGDFPNHNDVFTAVAGPRELTGDANSFQISLESPVRGGVKVTKTYTFTRGSYVIGVDWKVQNVGTAPVSPTLYMELVRDSQPVETPRFSHTFLGPAVFTNEHHFQTITFGDIDKKKADFVTDTDNGWVAMVQHYFATAWIPQEGVKRTNYVERVDNTLYRVGVQQPLGTIAPGASDNVQARLFAGPSEERMLAGIAPGLDLVKDYGRVALIAKPLFWLLEKIHSYVGNWGWSIVLLTVLIKAVFFPLSAASYKSMARMKEITPRMQALRERFKSDPQKMNAALMELYKTEKVNPFGGCLPVVIQIPVFISLYWVLLSSVEMRGAPWILWIHDLSQQDPFFILPVLMAVSMFLQTRLNPTPPDPVQAKMMMFMPIAFSVMFFFFPAGLVLYYVVNNVLSIAQQYYITRMMGKGKKQAKAS